MLLLVAACGGVAEFVRAQDGAQDRRDRDAAAVALTTYLQRVQSGDFQAAYGQLCIDVLEGNSEPAHERFLRTQLTFASFNLGEPSESSGMDGTYDDFPVRFVSASGSRFTVDFEVGLQADGPKICDGPGWRHPQA